MSLIKKQVKIHVFFFNAEQKLEPDLLKFLTPEQISSLTDNIDDKIRLVRGIKSLEEIEGENNYVSQ